MARINSEISNRIVALRFPLIVGVVLIHSQGSIVKFAEGAVGLQSVPYAAVFLQELTANVFSRVAVPLFFLISGFLFFSSLQPSLKSYQEKLKSRIRTLLIPYLLWSIATLLMLKAVQSIPGLSGYFSGGSVYSVDVNNLKWFEYLDLLFGLSQPPIAYAFWFIRDLFILIILSPVFLHLAKRAALPTLGILFLIWFFQIDYIRIPSNASVFFFYLGALWAIGKIPVKWLDQLGYKIVPIYLAMAIVDAVYKDAPYSPQLHEVTILIGMAFFWFLAGKVARNELSFNLLAKLSGFSFFVYAAHAPVLTLIKKLTYRFLIPQNAIEIILLYFLAPSLTILICLGAAVLLKRKFPGFYKLATGGR